MRFGDVAGGFVVHVHGWKSTTELVLLGELWWRRNMGRRIEQRGKQRKKKKKSQEKEEEEKKRRGAHYPDLSSLRAYAAVGSCL